jgi:hypothetical protein
VSVGEHLATLMIVPLPVWIPHPNGAKRLNSSGDLIRSFALTTDDSPTTESEAKEDWPKNEPWISAVSAVGADEEEGENVFFPKKHSSPALTQWDGWPDVQIWHEEQEAKERRTGSPTTATLTFFPTFSTNPEPGRG